MNSYYPLKDKLELDISKNSRNNQTLPQEENEIQTESKLETLDENCLKTLLTEANLPTVFNKQEDIRIENEILDAKNQSRPITDFLTSTQKVSIICDTHFSFTFNSLIKRFHRMPKAGRFDSPNTRR